MSVPAGAVVACGGRPKLLSAGNGERPSAWQLLEWVELIPAAGGGRGTRSLVRRREDGSNHGRTGTGRSKTGPVSSRRCRTRRFSSDRDKGSVGMAAGSLASDARYLPVGDDDRTLVNVPSAGPDGSSVPDSTSWKRVVVRNGEKRRTGVSGGPVGVPWVSVNGVHHEDRGRRRSARDRRRSRGPRSGIPTRRPTTQQPDPHRRRTLRRPPLRA